MTAPDVFEYALVRVVPRVERGEAVNVGVIVYSQAFRYLCARIELDESRLLAEVTALVPPGWFGDRGADAYIEHLLQRAPIVPEVIRP